MFRKWSAIWPAGLFILALILANALPAAAVINDVPFSDDFEVYTNQTPLIDGLNGWFASSNSVIVQTSVVYSGTNAAMIPPDTYLSNRFNSVYDSNIWATMRVRPGLDNAGLAANAELSTNSTVLFYVNTSGYFVVYNGNSGWQELPTMLDGAASPRLASNTWSRVDLGINHSNRVWTLFVNYQLISTNIQFANTNVSSFSGFDVHGPGLAQTNYLDSVVLTYQFPSNLTEQTNNWNPVLGVDVTNIARTIYQGLNAPSNSFHIWKQSGCFPMPFTNAIIYTNCGVYTNWLSITPSSDTSYGDLRTMWLVFDATNLPASNQAYRAYVRIDGTNNIYGLQASNSPFYVSVALTVQGSPALWVSPLYLTNSVTVGYRALPQSIYIANTSTPPRASMAYSVSSPDSWISPSSGSGSVVDETNTVGITYLTENLTAGWHTGTATVTATGIRTQDVVISMRVNCRPVLSWDAGQKTWTNVVVQGGTLSSFTFDVWNGSADPTGTLRFALASSASWLNLNPVSGTSSGAHQTVTVSYNVSGLPPGVHTGAVTLTGTDDTTGAPASNSPLAIIAQVTVKGRAVLATDVDAISNSILESYGDTNSAAFRVYNGAVEPRGGLNFMISSCPAWLQISPTSGTVTNETNAFSVIWLTQDKAPGTYSGSIVVDGTDAVSGGQASGAPKTIRVQVTVLSRTPVNLEKPTIYGTPYIGQTLTAREGLWQNRSRLTLAYQWQSATNVSGCGLGNIAGETTTNHVVAAGERGRYMRIAVTATDNNPSPRSATAYSEFTANSKIRPAPGDFNMDGISDLWFFDPLSGMWRASFTANSFGEGQYGGPGMIDVPGDYNADGIMDLGLYDPSSAMWYVLMLPSGPGLSGSMFGGLAEEKEATPVPADYDGDGQTDIALYWRGCWAILYSTRNRITIIMPFADQDATPVPADYDGDAIIDLAAYKAGLWTIRNVYGEIWNVSFGSSTWLPAPADYDGDTIGDLCVYNQATNLWAIVYSSTGTTNTRSFGSSNGANLPCEGYYDHDPYCDPATIQYSTDGDFVIWCVTRTTDTNFTFRGQSYQKSINKWRVSW
jgi:hypothetical protein